MAYLVLAVVCLITFGLIAFATYILYLEYCNTDLYKVLENLRSPEKKMSRAEKKSRKRVADILHSNRTPIQKCVALDKEIATLYTQVTVSKHWKKIVTALFNEVLGKNNLTLKSNRYGGTYIVSKINEGEFSKCLMAS